MQLVLPLRSSAEWRIATALAERGDAGLDVTILRCKGVDDIGAAMDGSVVQKMVAASDRAFVLTAPLQQGAATDSLRLAAFCDVCDTVLLACEEADQASGLLAQIGDGPARRVELVAMRF